MKDFNKKKEEAFTAFAVTSSILLVWSNLLTGKDLTIHNLMGVGFQCVFLLAALVAIMGAMFYAKE